MGGGVQVRVCQFVDFTGGRSDRCGSEGRPFLFAGRQNVVDPRIFRDQRIVRLCPPHEAEWRNRVAWDPLPDLPLDEGEAVVWEVMDR
jgi:hypothetical protein